MLVTLGFVCYSCNSNSKAPSAVKVCIAGSDSYVNTVLRPYVEQFSAKPPDWQTYVKFLIIPFGKCLLSIIITLRGILWCFCNKHSLSVCYILLHYSESLSYM